MSEHELKPCPFCGGKPVIYKSMSDRRAWVMCSECGATSPSGFREKTAIKAWNRRANDEAGKDVI